MFLLLYDASFLNLYSPFVRPEVFFIFFINENYFTNTVYFRIESLDLVWRTLLLSRQAINFELFVLISALSKYNSSCILIEIPIAIFEKSLAENAIFATWMNKSAKFKDLLLTAGTAPKMPFCYTCFEKPCQSRCVHLIGSALINEFDSTVPV